MAGNGNSAQRDFWSGPSGKSWVTHEARQDALLHSVAELIIARAELQSGERVLDVGCGTGAVSELAAHAVGGSGSVLATDISAPLLDRAAQRLNGLSNVSVQLGDAASADWPKQPFDVAVSRFGVMFFDDPPAAFAHIMSALRPDGRVVFAAWGPLADNPYWSIGAEAARNRLGALPSSPPNAPGPLGLADQGYATSVLRQAGPADFTVSPETIHLEYPGTAVDLADLMVALGPARRIINAFEGSAADAAAIRDGIAERLAPYEGNDGRVALPASINLIQARTK